MLKGGYQIIDFEGYSFNVESMGGPPRGNTVRFSEDFYEPFKNRKVKLFSGFTINGITYDDFFAECIKIDEDDTFITKYYHAHMRLNLGDINSDPASVAFQFILDKRTKTVIGSWVNDIV